MRNLFIQLNFLETSCRQSKKVLNFLTKAWQKHYNCLFQIHRKVRNFHCDVCPYSAFFKHSLEVHVLKHIPEEFRDRFLCDECNFVSISAANIVMHKKYDHGKNVLGCEVEGCKKKFSRPGQLKAHIRLTHQKIKDKICDCCKRSFSTSKNQSSITCNRF